MTCSRGVFAAAMLFGAVALAAPSEETSLDQLAWMAGTWIGTTPQGVEMLEHWTDAKGGLMLGMHRDIKAGRAISYEFFRILSTPTGLVYMASPRGNPPTPFRLAELGEKRVVFANPEHDFPQRITYRLTPDGSLNARVEGALKGRISWEEWTWKRSR